jgi:mannose-6-phosphate isomerase-like protein (cupin superfamily)
MLPIRSILLGILLAIAASAGAADITYFGADQVSAAFAKGAVLFDGTGTNYMVHASRRDAAGQAEVHEKDTDVIYVLGGSSMFVTGGTVRDGKITAAGEIRGVAIEGGAARQLAKGDVIIVPKGTPHWFKEVDAPLTYFVVKVR